jgi:hypothetical protein
MGYNVYRQQGYIKEISMKKVIYAAGFISFVLNVLAGCASTIPMSSNINDFVMLGIRTNNNATVAYQYSSQVIDGKTKFYSKDKEKIDGSRTAAVITEGSTLNRMLNNYMESKFTKISPDGNITIRIDLQDFWLESYTENLG